MSADPVAEALAALAQGSAAQALALLRGAGAAIADHPLALQAWSVALEGENETAASLALAERAARIAPSDAQAYFNWAVQLQAMNDLPAAMARYAQALRLIPDHLGALNNLSDLYRRNGRSAEGYALMQRFLASGGASAGQEIRLAKLALDTHRLEEAERWFSAAAKADPANPLIAFEHAMLLLLREDWARGWAGYEARLALYGPGGLAMANYPLPAWDGRSPGHVLIHREQGLGDTMMFAAAIPDMIAEGITPHIAQAPSLYRLFAESFPGAHVWSSITVIGVDQQPEQPFLRVCGPLDAQAPVCSLGALRMGGGPPPPRPYLRAPAHEIPLWKERTETLAPRLVGKRRVGLCFAARRPAVQANGAVNGELKSIPGASLNQLADVPHTQWFSLHDSSTAPLLADGPSLDIVDLSPWITDFADTAAAIAHLDLVITVDTAVAHLAGGLGAPTWLLLRRNADWRWGVDREDAVWYPQMRVFRQTTDGDWAPVVAAVARALS